MSVRKITKKEVLENCARLWFQHRTSMSTQNVGITYEEFCKEVLKEWQKQNRMSFKELEKYRKNKYNELVLKMNKNLKKSEIDLLNESDMEGMK